MKEFQCGLLFLRRNRQHEFYIGEDEWKCVLSKKLVCRLFPGEYFLVEQHKPICKKQNMAREPFPLRNIIVEEAPLLERQKMERSYMSQQKNNEIVSDKLLFTKLFAKVPIHDHLLYHYHLQSIQTLKAKDLPSTNQFSQWVRD